MMGGRMTPEEAVKEVNQLWEYKSDGRIDDWTFTTKGDCEDYALSVLRRIYGSSSRAKRALLRRDAFIWYVTADNGRKHAVLEYEGRYVCNRTKKWHTNRDNMRVKEWHWKFPRALLVGKLGLSEIF